MTRIVLASSNPGKLREFAALLAPLRFELLSQAELGISTPEETGTTFLENALLKARYAAEHAGLPALADDSGLEVDALGGGPGVRSARYAGAGASERTNLERLLRELATRRRGSARRAISVSSPTCAAPRIRSRCSQPGPGRDTSRAYPPAAAASATTRHSCRPGRPALQRSWHRLARTPSATVRRRCRL